MPLDALSLSARHFGSETKATVRRDVTVHLTTGIITVSHDVRTELDHKQDRPAVRFPHLCDPLAVYRGRQRGSMPFRSIEMRPKCCELWSQHLPEFVHIPDLCGQ